MNVPQRHARIVTIALFAVLLAVVWTATDLHAAVIGSLRNVSGPVDIMRGGALPAVAARNDDQVASGDLVRTKTNGFAEVVYKDGTVLRISERSRVDIGEHFSGKNPNGSEVRLARGKVRAIVDLKNVAAQGAKKFEVRTPNAIAGVRGTDLTVASLGNTTNIFVQTGTVYSYNPLRPGQIVTLTPGTLTTVTGLNPPAPPRPASPQDIQRMQQGTSAPPSGSGASGGGTSGSGGSGGGASGGSTQGGTSSSGGAGGTAGGTGGTGGGAAAGAGTADSSAAAGAAGSSGTPVGSTTSSSSVFAPAQLPTPPPVGALGGAAPLPPIVNQLVTGGASNVLKQNTTNTPNTNIDGAGAPPTSSGTGGGTTSIVTSNTPTATTTPQPTTTNVNVGINFKGLSAGKK